MFTEDIRRVDLSWDVVEQDHPRCHCLTCVVVREPVPSLVEWRVWKSATLDNGFVVSEQVRPSVDLDA